MAENYLEVLGALESTLNNFNATLRNQGVGNLVVPYEGDPKQCRNWINSIEKFADLNKLDQANKIHVTYMMARGPVSDFIQRWQSGNQQPTWADLVQNLLAHFSSVTDSDHAHDILRKIKQKNGETVSLYAERIFLLARDAYSPAELNDPGANRVAQKQLVSYFIDGLQDRAIKLKIMRINPVDLSAALKIAREEHNLMARFDLRTQHSYSRPSTARDVEPMEVDQVRRRVCHACGKEGHYARDCRRRDPRNGRDNRREPHRTVNVMEQKFNGKE